MASLVPILGLALGAAGTGVQMASQSAENRRAENAAQNEYLRQKSFQGNADTVFNQSLANSGFKASQPQMAKGISDTEAKYAKTESQPLAAPMPTGSEKTSQVITPDSNTQTQMASNQANRAVLMGLSPWELDQEIKNQQAVQNLGLIGSLARSSNNVLPMELQQAAHSADRGKAWGMGLSAAGSLAGLGSAAGLFSAPASMAATAGSQYADPTANLWWRSGGSGGTVAPDSYSSAFRGVA